MYQASLLDTAEIIGNKINIHKTYILMGEGN